MYLWHTSCNKQQVWRPICAKKEQFFVVRNYYVHSNTKKVVRTDLCLNASFIQDLSNKHGLFSNCSSRYIKQIFLRLCWGVCWRKRGQNQIMVSYFVTTKSLKLQVCFTLFKMLIAGRCFCFSSSPSYLTLTSSALTGRRGVFQYGFIFIYPQPARWNEWI